MNTTTAVRFMLGAREWRKQNLCPVCKKDLGALIDDFVLSHPHGLRITR